MYAIVEIAGQQFKVEKDQQIFVHRLEDKEGSKVEFDTVLLIDNNGKIKVGAPAIGGAKVTAKVLGHEKGDKVIVFKKKRRKGYRVKNGHRQSFTKIEIQSIVEKSTATKKTTSTKPTTANADAKATAEKASTPKKATATKAKATTTKKTSATSKPKTSAKAKTTAKADAKTASKSTTKKTTAKKTTTKKTTEK